MRCRRWSGWGLLLASTLLGAAGCRRSQAPSAEPECQGGREYVLTSPEWQSTQPWPGTDRRCLRNATCEWEVYLAQGTVKARTRSPSHDNIPRSLRLQLPHPMGNGDRTFARRLGDGWLVGLNKGEFGGGVWWFDPASDNPQQLSSALPVAFLDASVGLLVPVAVEGEPRSEILVVELAPNGRVHTRTWAAIDGSPTAASVDKTDVVIATDLGMIRIDQAAKARRIDKTDLRGLYPNSMAIDAHGRIFVGMRFAVATFDPDHGVLRERWLVHSSCREWQRAPGDDAAPCLCKGDRKTR
jgi:hypothetical protein